MEPRDLARASLVCKQWNRVVSNSPVWSATALHLGLVNPSSNKNDIMLMVPNFFYLCNLISKSEPLPSYLNPSTCRIAVAEIFKEELELELRDVDIQNKLSIRSNKIIDNFTTNVSFIFIYSFRNVHLVVLFIITNFVELLLFVMVLLSLLSEMYFLFLFLFLFF